MDLWKFYLIYVRLGLFLPSFLRTLFLPHVATCSRVNPNSTDLNARQTIKKAYEFALNHVGQDKDSGEIWRDYIDFLKTAEACGMSING